MKILRNQFPLAIIGLAWFAGSLVGVAAEPRLLDDRLSLTLFAEDPRIVTPIGLAIDAQNRLFVLESHTHTPPPDYAGPSGDRIKIFTDANGDGRSDGEPEMFAEGINAGMNLGFSRDGTLYVCGAFEVIALPDRDGDGRAEENKTVLRLETRNTYPHSAQMGIAFSHDDWIYITRGNNGGHAWTVHGTDGSSVSGYGDGGSVYRCRLDGSRVEAVATGFWNSMNLKFDSHGRLLLVDNDPDARGPNRLVHVVEQGDYGHKSVFGGGGNHPFQGWDGTLPGTLGYVDGIGEAPCDLIDTDRTSFPVDYRDQLLVTVWNENHVARYRPEPNGASLTATHEIWLQGDVDFRPVALEADSHGNLFITDWVLVDYPNHGRGRLWRVSTKERRSPIRRDATAETNRTGSEIGAPIERLAPRGYFDELEPDPATDDFASLITADQPEDFRRLERALISDDPFIRHAAVVALSRPVFLGNLVKSMYRGQSLARLGALLAMRRGRIRDPELYLKRFLGDPDESVRRAALMWVGEEGLVNLRPDIDKAIAFDDLSATIFATYLATLETLDPAYLEAFKAQRGRAPQIRRRVDPATVEAIVRDEDRPERVRALALIHLENLESDETVAMLKELAGSGGALLRKEAIRSLSETIADVNELLLGIATDRAQPTEIRAEALLALSKSLLDDPAVLLPLLDDPDRAVQVEALRALRIHASNERVRARLDREFESAQSAGADRELIEQYEFALFPPGTKADRVVERPESMDEWQHALRTGGDPAAGERLFFAAQTQCAGCHLIDNRGRRIGPELSNLGQSVSREQIVHSILRPGDAFAPEYQAWFVELKDGEYFQGLQLDHKANRGIEMFTTEGITRSFKGPDIEGFGVLPNSLMPDGLEQTMTVGELRDLVAFLESRK